MVAKGCWLGSQFHGIIFNFLRCFFFLAPSENRGGGVTPELWAEFPDAFLFIVRPEAVIICKEKEALGARSSLASQKSSSFNFATSKLRDTLRQGNHPGAYVFLP